VSSVVKVGGPFPIAVTVTVALWPAFSEPVDGLTLRPSAADGGTVIVNVTGPPSAVSVKVAVAGPSGDWVSVIVAGDSSSVPGTGAGDGVAETVAVGVGADGGVVVVVAEGVPTGLGVAAGDEPAEAAALRSAGDRPDPVGGGDGPAGEVDAPVCAALCAAALAGAPPCRSSATAASPPATISSIAAAAVNRIVRRPGVRVRPIRCTGTGNPDAVNGSARWATRSR
jgi:hypothetical protein